jgi:CRISPR-associated protein Csb2
MLALEVEYLLGRVFAGGIGDRSESEWPPHPARLFSAFAAAYFDNGSDAQEREALLWFERQGPPSIRAGEPGTGVPVVAYVPPNFPNSTVPVLRKGQPRYFPGQAPAEATVYFVWPGADPAPGVADTLLQIAGRIAYLGKACSVVRICGAATPPAANYEPFDEGSLALRVPAAGRLEELRQLFQAGLRPTPGWQQLYRRVGDATVQPPPVESAFEHLLVLRRSAGPRLPVEDTLTATEALRGALLSIAGEGGASIPEVIHGHHGGSHCAYLALPFVGSPNADGDIKGCAVAIPRGTPPAERRLVEWLCQELAVRSLKLGAYGAWNLEPIDVLPAMQSLRTYTWARPSTRWSSVTPILLDRFPKKHGPTIEQILTTACTRAGLPEPAAIVHGPYARVAGVPPVAAFRVQRDGETRRRWGVHATLEFAEPVKGPVLLGAGRYFGLGLLRPVAGEEAQ